MAVLLPKDVQLQVREGVYRKADEFGYMSKSRVDNGVFMDNLVKDYEVGGLLAQYIDKGTIKTYIKDAILNRYMKEKKKTILPTNPESFLPIVRKFFNQEAHSIYAIDPVYLFRLDNNDMLLIAQGTLVKWETALRKALEFIAKAPGLPPKEGDLNIVLNIATLGQPSTQADRDHLKKALSYVNVILHFAELP